jgi:patatin-like phospholipase/acyl hydrolase
MKINKLKVLSIAVCCLVVALWSEAQGMEPLESRNAEHVRNNQEYNDMDKPFRILSIDGGGIRGLIPATILDHMEVELKKQLGASMLIAEFFDLVAGTSTGGIIALGINVPNKNGIRPRYPAKILADLYERNGADIFPPNRWTPVIQIFTNSYSTDPLNNVLERYFQKKNSETLKLRDSFTRVFIPAYDADQNSIHYFDSNTCGDKFNYSFKDVGLATSAAPTFLAEAKIKDSYGVIHKYIDGGMFVNNPALAALLNMRAESPNKKFFVLSIGTGEATNYVDLGEGGIFRRGGFSTWALQAPAVLMRGASQHNDQLLRTIATEEKQKYYRIQTEITLEAEAMDDPSIKNITFLRGAAHKVATGERVKEVIKDLILFAIEGDLLKSRIKRNFDHQFSNPAEVGKLNLNGIPLNGEINLKIFDQYLSTNKGDKIKKIHLKFAGITKNSSYSSDSLEKILKILSNRSPNLEYLNLSGNEIGNEDHIQVIIDFLNYKKSTNSVFSRLVLSKNRINDTGGKRILKTLIGNRNMKYIDLSDNPIKSEVIEILRKELPSNIEVFITKNAKL